jgi:ribosomal protein S1
MIGPPVSDISLKEQDRRSGHPLDPNATIVLSRAVVETGMGRHPADKPEKKGSAVKGIVDILNTVRFVDLGGVTALLHITDMAWRACVTERSGDSWTGNRCQILKFDTEKNACPWVTTKQMGDDSHGSNVNAASRKA